MTLRNGGFIVDVALNGRDGIKLVKNNPDLIILDVMLPEMNGIDVLKELKSNDHYKSIPVFMLSNLGQDSIVQEALKIGATEYIIKLQIDPYELVKRATDLLATQPES